MGSEVSAHTDWQHADRPPELGVEAYRELVEKLLVQGRGYGKTEPVAAYPLSNIRLVITDDEEDDDGRHEMIEVEPVYIVMDMKMRPNEYARALELKEIFSTYARRMIEGVDLNHVDFFGPGVWTSKESGFEFDYKKRNPDNPKDHIYDPNPDAYRVCMKITDKAVTIPTEWGEPWTIEPNGALAIREKDVPALAEALRNIREGRISASDALFEWVGDKKVAKFDVYGMAPDFLYDNYNPVFLSQETLEFRDDIAEAQDKDDAPKIPSATPPEFRGYS